MTPLSLAGTLLMVAACGILEPEISEQGVVTLLEIEGGCWVIETDETTYLPLNLPGNLHVDGLSVQFEGERRTDLSSVCPGSIIHLIFIESVVGEGGA